MIKTTIKSLIAAVPMGITTLISYNLFHIFIDIGLVGEVISLIIAVSIGAIVYGIVIMIEKVDEINIIIDLLEKKFKIPKTHKRAYKEV